MRQRRKLAVIDSGFRSDFGKHRHVLPTVVTIMNRNRYFLIGLLLILIGVQFRMVESVVLNEQTTRALARMTNAKPVASNDMLSSVFMQVYPSPKKRIAPPRWIGLALIAVGAVISLHAVAIPKQG